MKKLILIAVAGFAISCSKGGGGNDNNNTAATVTTTSASGSSYCDGSSTAGINNYNGYYGNTGFNAGNAYWPYNYGNTGYQTASCNCSQSVYTDFAALVLVNCGFNNPATSLYSTQCKNGYVNFRNKYPSISCYYNNSGIFGVLNTNYLNDSINTLQSRGY